MSFFRQFAVMYNFRKTCLKYRYVLLLFGVLALAALMRFWQLGQIGFRGDEALYAGQAAILSGDQDMKRYFILISRGNSNFLIYQGILALLYFFFGVSDILARIVSASFSLFTVAATYELGKTLYNRRVGLIAALLLSLSAYSIALGRLALLDSTLVFFFTLSMVCIVKWTHTNNDKWLYGFVISSALAMQTKVAGVLILFIAAIYILASRKYKNITIRKVLVASVVFAVSLTPTILQLVANSGQIIQFLSQSTRRVSETPWYYYGSVIIGYEGYIMPLIWIFSLLFAFKRKNGSVDILCIVWILIVFLFYQKYPLKAFNYLLPLVPAFSLLTAGAVTSLLSGMKLRHAKTALLLALLVGATILPVSQVLGSGDYAGMREASYWLKVNAPPEAGVMAISRGSGQSVISFYAKRDAYPFGRFWLATVLPGGVVLNPRPAIRGTPTDWVSYWPDKLIQQGIVSYLVFYTNAGDDPPEEPITDTITQRDFRLLIEAYGGQLVHTEYYNHEGRVWIYKVGKLLPKPHIAFSADADNLKVEGDGFRIKAQVTIYYKSVALAVHETDQRGSFSATLPLQDHVHPLQYLTVMDEVGNYASLTGEHIWGDVDQETDPLAIAEADAPERIADEQIADLNAIAEADQPKQIAGGQTTTPTPRPAESSAIQPATTATPLPASRTTLTLNRILHRGSSGDDVVRLQLRLRELGYFGYVENTGYLGSVTLDAILHFQADHKLPETGVVDLMTIEALNRLGEDAGAGTGAPMPDRQGDGTP